MFIKRFLIIAVVLTATYYGCAEKESLALTEGRRLIRKTHAKYAENKQILQNNQGNLSSFDLAKFIRSNTEVTIALHDGIKALARKYPKTSAEFANTPTTLGRELGSDIKPLFTIVNQLASDIRVAMRRHPEKEKASFEYQELTIAWLKVLALFGGELKQG